MSDTFKFLHGRLVHLKDKAAFDEFMTVYKFRGGKYTVASFQDLINFYYCDENGKEDKTRPLLAHANGYGWEVNTDEYQLLIDLKNILVDKRISEIEFRLSIELNS